MSSPILSLLLSFRHQLRVLLQTPSIQLLASLFSLFFIGLLAFEIIHYLKRPPYFARRITLQQYEWQATVYT